MNPKKARHSKERNLWVLSLFHLFPACYHIIFLLVLYIITSTASHAQSVNDTIYYDNYWRICEKPVARYFRLGELKMDPQWHFANTIKDFYMEGQPEMTGNYLPTGSKSGEFTFYHANGKIKRKGVFVNDTMKGTWSYFDTRGELYFQMNCESSRSFTPLFIKNPGGDTLLKNGTGRFAFKLLDYPDVFPAADEYMVKGQCLQGKRTGTWMYDAFYTNNWRQVANETYDAGIFLHGTVASNFLGEKDLSQPAFIGELGVSKLLQTEIFVHDPVFGEGKPNAYPPQLVNFLLRGDIPGFASGAKKFEANVLDYLALCSASVGYGRLSLPGLAWHGVSTQSAKVNQNNWLLGYCIQTDNNEITHQSDLFPIEKLKSYAALINFSVYENGTTSDVSVKGNFDKDIMLHLAYYLSRMTSLAPRLENSKPVPSHQILYLFTKTDTATYRKHSYIIYRLMLSLKPPDQTADRFTIADFANEKFETN